MGCMGRRFRCYPWDRSFHLGFDCLGKIILSAEYSIRIIKGWMDCSMDKCYGFSNQIYLGGLSRVGLARYPSVDRQGWFFAWDHGFVLLQVCSFYSGWIVGKVVYVQNYGCVPQVCFGYE